MTKDNNLSIVLKRYEEELKGIIRAKDYQAILNWINNDRNYDLPDHLYNKLKIALIRLGGKGTMNKTNSRKKRKNWNPKNNRIIPDFKQKANKLINKIKALSKENQELRTLINRLRKENESQKVLIAQLTATQKSSAQKSAKDLKKIILQKNEYIKQLEGIIAESKICKPKSLSVESPKVNTTKTPKKDNDNILKGVKILFVTRSCHKKKLVKFCDRFKVYGEYIDLEEVSTKECNKKLETAYKNGDFDLIVTFNSHIKHNVQNTLRNLKAFKSSKVLPINGENENDSIIKSIIIERLELIQQKQQES